MHHLHYIKHPRALDKGMYKGHLWDKSLRDMGHYKDQTMPIPERFCDIHTADIGHTNRLTLGHPRTFLKVLGHPRTVQKDPGI